MGEVRQFPAPGVWPEEREGYSDSSRVLHPVQVSAKPRRSALKFEETLGSLLAGAGAIWAVKVATSTSLHPLALVWNSRPIEMVAAGILIWMHAKWRRSSNLR